MKTLLIFLLSLPLLAQLPNQWVGANINFDQYSANKVTGSLAYARQVSSGAHPIYSYNAINLVSIQKEPFRLMTNPESGLAIHITKFSMFEVFALGSAGVALAGNSDGTNAGFSGSGGGFAQTKIKGNWTIGPIVRVSKTTISEIQWSVGLVIGLSSN